MKGTPNNAINTDGQEQCSFVALLLAAGYGGRWAVGVKCMSIRIHLLLLLCLTALAQAAAPVLLTMEAYGDVKIGMTVEQAYELLGRSQEVFKPQAVMDACDYYRPLRGVSFMAHNRKIVRIDIDEDVVVTPSGFRVGDAVSEVKEKFAGRIKQDETGEGYQRLIVYSNDGKRAMRFDVSYGLIRYIYAGEVSVIQLVEGCV